MMTVTGTYFYGLLDLSEFNAGYIVFAIKIIYKPDELQDPIFL